MDFYKTNQNVIVIFLCFYIALPDLLTYFLIFRMKPHQRLAAQIQIISSSLYSYELYKQTGELYLTTW